MRSLPTRLILAVATAALLVPVHEVQGQVRSIGISVGVTGDLKPNPFSGTTETNSAGTVGGTLLFGSDAARPKGLAVSWSRFGDGAGRVDLQHLDVVAVLGLTRWDDAYVHLQGGLSRASWTASNASTTSLDWVVGPVFGYTIPLGGRAGLDLSGVTQFRWSPDHNDYLRIGARAGLSFLAGG